MRLSELAERLGGSLSGENIDVTTLSTPENQKPGSVCVLSDKKLARAIDGMAAAYVTDENFPDIVIKPQIRVKKPRAAVLMLINILLPEKPHVANISTAAYVAENAVLAEGVSVGAGAVIGENVTIGKNTRIYPGVVIGDNVSIGEDTRIYPNVSIYDDTEIGSKVIIHAGAVIGADGFGFIPGEVHSKIPHRGKVIIEDDVEIGASTTVDRGTIDSTVIGRGTKIDNQVQIGHNVRIGTGCLIVAHTGIAGSTTVGDYVTIGGQAGLADHITVGSFTSFAAQSGVHQDIPEKSGAYGGTPAVPAALWGKQMIALTKLPDLRKRLIALEKKIYGDNNE